MRSAKRAAMTFPFAPELRIDLDALADNFAALQRRAGAAEVAPVLKANAYGLGQGPVARRLWREGARRFFVARRSEGEALRADLGRRSAEILVLDGCLGDGDALRAASLTPVINSQDQITAWSGTAPEQDRPTLFALQVDTGLNRLGLTVAEALMLAETPVARDCQLVISHLACADTPDHPLNGRQAKALAALRPAFPKARFSLAASSGIFLSDAFRFNMVRPGIALFGVGPFETPHPEIRPVARLTAPVLQIRHVAEGEAIGYGAGFIAPQALKIALVGAGYADGVLRSGGANGYGFVGGERRPFVGRVSMDILALDVTGLSDVHPGDCVELFGDHLRLEDVARAANTISYEILSRIAPRVTRTYLGDDEDRRP